MEENYNTVEYYLGGTADQKRKADDWMGIYEGNSLLYIFLPRPYFL